MIKITLVTLLVTLLLVSFISADESSTTAVHIVTPDNIGDFVEGPTLMEFFAPWCGHCKKLAPIYEQLANHYNIAHPEKNVKIASLNCVDYSELCGAHGIRGYPTIKFFINDNDKEYKGARSVEEMISYVETMLKSPIVVIESESQLEPLLTKPDTNTFIYMNSENEAVDSETFKEFNKIAIDIQDIISPNFIRITDPNLVKDYKFKPSVTLIKDGEHIEYKGSLEGLSQWIKKNQYPIISELSPDRVSSIGKSYKYIALFIYDSLITISDKEVMRKIAKKEDSEEHDFIFLYFQASKNKRWLESYELGKKPTMVVFISDSLDLYYYDETITHIESNIIGNFLNKVKNGEVSMKYTDPFNYFIFMVTTLTVKYQYYLIAICLSIPILIYWTCCGGSDKEDEKEKEN